MGNDTAIMLGSQSGRFELNVAMPLIAYNLIQSVDLMTHAANLMADKCVFGLTANRDHCENYIDKSLALATTLVTDLGYDHAAQIAKTAFDTGRTVRETVLDLNVMPEEKIDLLLGSKNESK
jgi:fumarate hydratase class II